MNRVPFGEGACEKTRKYMDSYMTNELLIETNHEVIRHLDGCPACTAELEARTQLRARLKSAVKSQSVPPELQVRIRQQIRTRESASWFTAGWGRWAAAAASVVVCAGIWLNQTRHEQLPGIADRPAQSVYIQKVSATLSAVLKVGLSDHIHCSIFRKYPQDPPPVQHMESELGPSFQGLLPVVRAAVPDGYRVIMAHHCSYAGRRYVHLTLEKDGELLSLVIAKKNDGESMEGLARSSQPSGVPIHQASAGRYQVAGFEAGEFLAYVISDLKGRTNLQIAANLAPGVHEFLMKTPA